VITPEYFRFRDVVPDNDRSAPSGGWRAVCIHALIKHGDSDARTVCKFEVGVPIRNEQQGEISVEEAQFAAASMANRAAREVLAEAHPGEMFAVLCRNFKKMYRPMLKAKIAGSEVGECTTAGTETVLFGITTGVEPSP
jgi:outer membrane PBP1 activator LpoA protein